jgi:hypothetical protein
MEEGGEEVYIPFWCREVWELFNQPSGSAGRGMVEAMEMRFDPHPAPRGVGIAIGLVEPLTERTSMVSRWLTSNCQMSGKRSLAGSLVSTSKSQSPKREAFLN